MPFFEYIPLVLSGVQALAGLTASDKNRPKPRVPGGVEEAVANAQVLANATVSPGYTTAEQTMCKAAADMIAQAQRTVTDPTQLQDAISHINSVTQENINNLASTNEQYHVQMVENLNNQLSNLAKAQFDVQQLKDQQYMEKMAVKSNLLGGAVANVNQFVNMKQAAKMQANFPSMVDYWKNIFSNNTTPAANTSTYPNLTGIQSAINNFAKPTLSVGKYYPVLGSVMSH